MSYPLMSHKKMKIQLGVKWTLIFYHNVDQNESYLFQEEEALDIQTETKYSILEKASKFPKIQNKYEFLLEYPREPQPNANYWQQSNFPSTLSDPDPNFKCLNCSYTNSFKGLFLGSSQTAYLTGTTGGIWFFAIAPFRPWSAPWGWSYVVPSYVGNETKEVALWMRVPNSFGCEKRSQSHSLSYSLFLISLSMNK